LLANTRDDPFDLFTIGKLQITAENTSQHSLRTPAWRLATGSQRTA
jgi:hypothetical protein